MSLFTFKGKPEQDFIMLGGQQSPGQLISIRCDSPRKWDERPGYGLSGATIVFAGKGLAHVDVALGLWLPEHFDAWSTFARAVLKDVATTGTLLGSLGLSLTPGIQPGSALSIVHPLVNLPPWNVSNVVVADVSAFDQDDDGMWTTTLKLIEWRKPKPVLAKIDQSTPPTPDTPPTARSEADKTILELWKELNAL